MSGAQTESIQRFSFDGFLIIVNYKFLLTLLLLKFETVARCTIKHCIHCITME